MALYNKMRPKSFSQVMGQEKVVGILKNNLQSGNLPNAMLLIGTRGVGKTTIAKVIARMVNCEVPLEDGSCCDSCASCRAILAGSSLDVLELDAASNNGVDHIRAILEKIQLKPLGKKTVIILDEVHMLSMSAFNALLKTLEEPPKDVLFILCTTELHKVPATIVSRCRKFQFETISPDVIVEKLQFINKELGLEAEEEALYIVARAAKGSMRDAESIYETFLDTDGVITASYVRATLGFTTEENIFSLLDAVFAGNPATASAVVDAVYGRGESMGILLEDCLHTFNDITALKLSGDVPSGITAEYAAHIERYAYETDTQRLFEIASAFRSAYGKNVAPLALKAMLIELCYTQSSISQLESRVGELERQIEELLAMGIPAREAVPVTVATNAVSADTFNPPEETDDGIDYQAYDAMLAEMGDFEPIPEGMEDYLPFEGDILPGEDEQHEETPSNATSLQEPNISTPVLPSTEGDDELRALGLCVATDVPSFDEETLDDAMLEGAEIGTAPSVAQTSAPADDFFGEFARQFFF